MHATLDGAGLRATLDTLVALAGSPLADAGWTFAEGRLTVAWAGGSVQLAGEGQGSGTARVRGVDMAGLSGIIDAGAPVRVEARDGRLFLGAFSVAADAPAQGGVPQLLPVDPGLSDVLRLPFEADPDTIAAAGLAGALAEAQRERRARIEQALTLLGPLGVSAAALEACVDRCLAENARRA